MKIKKYSRSRLNWLNLIFIPTIAVLCFYFVIQQTNIGRFQPVLESSNIPVRIKIDAANAPTLQPIEMNLSERRISSKHALMAKFSPGYVSGSISQNEYYPPQSSRETYQDIDANNIHLVSEKAVSTFSVDVDTGGYTNLRRMLNAGRLPANNHVRIEEMINYFNYDYPAPSSKQIPFSISTALMPSPWNKNSHILRIGLKGFAQDVADLPATNIVFLVDVSGSMNSPDKLALVKQSLKLLTKNLRDSDRVAMVTYAGNTKVVLRSTSGKDKAKIIAAIEQLNAQGSTAGESGLKLAYAEAEAGLIKGGNNRIVMMTDGDFNVGLSSVEAMINLVSAKRKSGVFLSTIGFGQGNYREDMMEQMADHGNGQYFYIDSYNQAYRIFERNLRSSLFTIAKDVKIQIEFNPARIKEYRLIGYENRILKREDFNNDKVDAGDVGQGHSVTALYEITLVENAGQVDPLRYAASRLEQTFSSSSATSTELAFVKLRYKDVDSDKSQLINHPVIMQDLLRQEISESFNLAVAVAGFGQLLRNSQYLVDDFNYTKLILMLEKIKYSDPADIAELKGLVRLASSLN